MAELGRPPLYTDPLTMEAKIDQYFDKIGDDQPYWAELALHLGFASRKALYDYEQKPAFRNTIKRAKLRVEVARNKMLLNKDYPTAGVIFDLTNNHDWKNPQHMQHSGDKDGDPIQTVTKIELVAGGDSEA